MKSGKKSVVCNGFLSLIASRPRRSYGLKWTLMFILIVNSFQLDPKFHWRLFFRKEPVWQFIALINSLYELSRSTAA